MKPSLLFFASALVALLVFAWAMFLEALDPRKSVEPTSPQNDEQIALETELIRLHDRIDLLDARTAAEALECAELMKAFDERLREDQRVTP